MQELIETHLHFGGCKPPSFVWQTIGADPRLRWLAESEAEVVKQMTFVPGEEPSFHRFLNKFTILDHLPWTPALIEASVAAAAPGFAGRVLLDLSINKYMKLGLHKREVVSLLHAAFQRHCPGQVLLILSIKYESTAASKRQYLDMIHDPQVVPLLAGVDFVGDESVFGLAEHAGVLRDWRDAGKLVRAHVGELGRLEHLAEALTLPLTNVAHGLPVVRDRRLLERALELGLFFDVALTSNWLTGAVRRDQEHPLAAMLAAGLKVTLGSDDPVQLSTDLAAEYGLAEQLVGPAGVARLKANAATLWAKHGGE